MSAPSRLFTIPLAVGVLVIAGCGGDDGGDSLSKAEYVKQADAVCNKAQERLDALEQPSDLTDSKAVEEFFAQGKQISADQLAELRELEAPDEIAGDVDEAYDLLEGQLDRIDQLAEAIADEDQQKAQEIIAAGEADDKKADGLAKKVGLKECGNG